MNIFLITNKSDNLIGSSLILGAIGGYILITFFLFFIIVFRFQVLRSLEFIFLSQEIKKLSFTGEISYFVLLTAIKNIIYIPFINKWLYKSFSHFNINISSRVEEYLNYFGISQLLEPYILIYTFFILFISILFFMFICKWSFKSSLLITLLLFVFTKLVIGVVMSLIPLIMDFVLGPIENVTKITAISKTQIGNPLLNFLFNILFIPRFVFGIFLFRFLFWLPFP